MSDNTYFIKENLFGTPLYHWAITSPLGATTEYNDLLWVKVSDDKVVKMSIPEVPMTAQQIMDAHLTAMQRADWEDSIMSRLFERMFNALPLDQVGECMECGGRAKITCQYH
jgi:hypothetical protein